MKHDKFLSAIGAIIMLTCGYAANTLGKLADSVQDLNIKIAVVISHQAAQDFQAQQYDARIQKLEQERHR